MSIFLAPPASRRQAQVRCRRHVAAEFKAHFALNPGPDSPLQPAMRTIDEIDAHGGAGRRVDGMEPISPRVRVRSVETRTLPD